MKSGWILGALLASGLAAQELPTHPVQVPAQHRGQAPVVDNLARSKWFELFQDPHLQVLVNRALEQNLDLKQAVARVESARANLGIKGSDQWPRLNLTAALNQSLVSANSPTFVAGFLPRNRPFGEVLINLLNFEIDLFGRVHHQTQAAAAQLWASEEDRKAVMTALVAEVASSYFNLLEFDAELQLARATLGSHQATLALVEARERGGVASMLEVYQARQLVEQTGLAIAESERQVSLLENRLQQLSGGLPGPVERGSLLVQVVLPEVPAGLPSELLSRRPDIRSAELTLAAQEELSEVARRAIFPRISLTAFLGVQSSSLSNLFSSPSGTFFINPVISQPLFDAGLGSAEQLAESQQQLALLRYQQVVQQAFREVADGLSDHARFREIAAGQQQLVDTLEQRSRLAQARYLGGVDSQLNWLDAERDLFAARVGLAQARRNQLLSVVQLYKALGGGW